MSGFLFDTNAFLLLMLESEAAAASLRAALATEARYVSQVCAIEIAIKASIGKLDLPPTFQTSFAYAFAEATSALSADVLPIAMTHIEALSHLPLHHRDPFDRLIIGQAVVEDLTIVSRDRKFRLYPGMQVLEI